MFGWYVNELGVLDPFITLNLLSKLKTTSLTDMSANLDPIPIKINFLVREKYF